MPCHAIILAVQNLNTLEEVLEAAKALGYEAERQGDQVHVDIPDYRRVTFFDRQGLLEAPGLREDDRKALAAGKSVGKTKAFFRQRGLRVRSQQVTEKGIELTIVR
jgi:hypothetical protein